MKTRLLSILSCTCLSFGIVCASQLDAGWIVDVVRRLHEVGLPSDLPPRFKRYPDLRDAYDPTDVAVGFFYYQLLKGHDKELYKELRSFWRSSKRKRLEVLPELAQLSALEPDPDVRKTLLDVIDETLASSFDVVGREHVAAEVAWSVLDTEAPEEARMSVLEAYVKVVARLSQQATLRLMELVRGRDRDNDRIREVEIRALRKSESDALGEEVLNLLVEVANRDRSLRCRAAASRNLRLLFPDSNWIASHEEILGEALEEDSLVAIPLIWDLAIYERFNPVTPLLIRALNTSDPNVRADAILGLEKLYGLRGDDLGYPAILGRSWQSPSMDEERRKRLEDAQEQARSAWRSWWRKNCVQLFPEQCP